MNSTTKSVERVPQSSLIAALELEATMECLDSVTSLMSKLPTGIPKDAYEYVAGRLRSAIGKAQYTCDIRRADFLANYGRQANSDENDPGAHEAWKVLSRHFSS